MTDTHFPWHRRQGVRPLINVSGTMTGLGASIAAPGVAAATAEAMGDFVSIHEAQQKASAVISHLTGAEAGFLTASASAGITLAVAACLTGLDPARVEALPQSPGNWRRSGRKMLVQRSDSGDLHISRHATWGMSVQAILTSGST